MGVEGLSTESAVGGTAGSTPAAPAPRRASLRGALGGSGARWLLLPPLLLLTLLLLLPLGFMVETTLEGSNLSDAIGDGLFRDAVVRTVVMAAVVTALTLVLGTVYALGLAVAPRGVAIVLLVFLFTIFWTSLLVRTYGWILLYLPIGPIYQVLHALGLRSDPIAIYQTPYAMYPAMVHVMLPYMVLPVFAALRQLDPLQIRAGRVLGARPLLLLRKVILPQLRAGIVAGSILVFVMSLGFYITPQLVGDPSNPTIASIIGIQFGQPDGAGIATAMSVLLIAAVVAIYVISDRMLGVSNRWGRS